MKAMKIQQDNDEATFCSDDGSGSDRSLTVCVERTGPIRQPQLHQKRAFRSLLACGEGDDSNDDCVGLSKSSHHPTSSRSRRGRPSLQPTRSMRRQRSSLVPHRPAETLETSSSAEELFSNIAGALAYQTNQEVCLGNMIQFHTDRAMARYADNNTKGAVLSMRKIRSLKKKKENVADAIIYLSGVERNVKEHTEVAKKNLMGRRDDEGAHNIVSDLSPCSCRNFEQGLEIILSRSTSSLSSTDDDLLEELTSLFASSFNESQE